MSLITFAVANAANMTHDRGQAVSVSISWDAVCGSVIASGVMQNQ